MIDGKYDVKAVFAGKEMTGICDLKTDGDVLTGQIESMGNIIAVEDGKVDEDKFTYKCKFSTPMGLTKAKASGFVDGDHIEMTLKALIGKVTFKGERIS